MAKEPFLTTTDDEPGQGPDLPGTTSGDGRSTLARLLGERRLLRVPALWALPRPTLPRSSFSLPGALPGRRARRDDGDPAPEAVPGPDLDTALEDALVEALADDAAVTDGADGRLPDAAAADGGFDDVVAEWVRRVIAAYPRPTYPLEREWDVSVQGVVRLVPYVPRFATAPLALLDRFGAVTIGPRRVGLDGKDVDWDRVVEVRTAPAWTCLSAEALEVNLAQYVVALPPLPGRAWVLGKISELLLSLYLAVLPPDADGDDALADAHALLGASGDADVADADAPPDRMFDRVVTEVVYRRRFGTGEAQASTTSVLLQLALRGATDTIVRTAAERGVDVVHVKAEDTSIGTVVARAATWRRTALDLRERVGRRLGR
ncbi:hypothetical protein [Cellulosimicrobium funkei]|uniref:Uncharacterized protein n=1 Tax=Cellulosimicrobium funkei TaxID=264251 RepID=A0A4Y8R613_9MICO|nr:hypothetical protein [Cellulosimicrobium funkei]TFF17051.1 hypothetical protein E1O70_02425 [Cellulosimicrobium funkei]TGA70909.1 hypothetical protein EQW79_014480 [Cellulosimicrobium terreum]